MKTPTYERNVARLEKENAIKHNVVSPQHPLRIRLTIGPEGVSVENGIRLRANVERHGIGLHNLRQMYDMLGRKLRVDDTGGTFRVCVPYIK